MGKYNSLFQDEQEKAMFAKYENYLIEQKAAVQDGYSSRYAPLSFEDFCDEQDRTRDRDTV
jgi:hypothetical protein